MAKKKEEFQTPDGLNYISEGLRALAVPIDQLVEDPANARKHNDKNLRSIAASLRVYGQRKPIVVNKRNGVIEAGNGTLQAARTLKWTHIAAVFVDDDPNTAAGFSIADNRSAELAEWDDEALAKILAEIETEDEDLQQMLDDLAEDNEITFDEDDGPQGDPDEVPEPPAIPITKPGDLWLLGPYFECEACGKRYEYDAGLAMNGECPCG